MKVYPLHIIITLCTLLSSMMFVDSLWGQSLGDYLARYEIGFGAEKTIAEEFSLFNGGRVPNRTVRTVAYAGSLSIGIHIPLLTFGDQFGVGINPDIQLALGSAPYDPAFPEEIDHLDASSGIFRLTFPTLLSLKYGTDATMDPDTDMGFGLGLGYRPTFNLPLGYSYGEPIAMGEFSFIAGSALVKARITLPLAVGSPVDEVDLKTYDFSLYFLPRALAAITESELYLIYNRHNVQLNMFDARNKDLADKIINYSTRTEKGNNVLIEVFGTNGTHLAQEMARATFDAGAHPFIAIYDTEVLRIERERGSTEYWKRRREIAGLPTMKEMDVYIGLRAAENIYELSDVGREADKAYNEEYLHPVHMRERVNNTRWCVMRYPSPAFAMNARMSTNKFADFYYKACLLDYAELNERMKPLHELLAKSKEVHLVGEGTNIKLSIEGQTWIPCAGDVNIPDGEIFSAPILDSVNGHITYAPSVYNGKPFGWIRFEVKDGVIVDFDSDNKEALQAILETDEGARRFGEFAIGTNPHISEPMFDILFDEKIWGSIHLTPGQCYDMAPNGNNSAVHWDLVCIGSDVIIDGEKVRDGRKWIHNDLIPLNPENFS